MSWKWSEIVNPKRFTKIIQKNEKKSGKKQSQILDSSGVRLTYLTTNNIVGVMILNHINFLPPSAKSTNVSQTTVIKSFSFSLFYPQKLRSYFLSFFLLQMCDVCHSGVIYLTRWEEKWKKKWWWADKRFKLAHEMWWSNKWKSVANTRINE